MKKKLGAPSLMNCLRFLKSKKISLLTKTYNPKNYVKLVTNLVPFFAHLSQSALVH